MSAEKAASPHVDDMNRQRGYALDMHRIMAAEDPEWVAKYGAFIDATYTCFEVPGNGAK